MEVLEQHNFHNKKQIELLQVLSYALHKKHYPHDTCGIIDRKIKLLEQAELEAASPAVSPLLLAPRKGIKVNFIRVVNCLCELSFFTSKKGNNITKKEIFDIVGKTVNQDLTAFHNDLATTKAAANRDMHSTLAIFDLMRTKQQEINNK